MLGDFQRLIVGEVRAISQMGERARTDAKPGQCFMDLLRVRGKVGKHCPGSKDGYTIRYNIVPAGGNLPEEDANKAETFGLAATPTEYGKKGRRSFFLDSGGVLRGADKQGAAANSTDPRIGPA